MSSEDLSKEQKAQRRAEQDSLENIPFEFRAPPGYSPYPIMDPDRGGWRGRGRGRGRASATVTSDYSFWPQGSHSNKMATRGGLVGQGRGLGRPFPYPMPGTSSDLALEFSGGYEQAREDDSRLNFGSEVK